MLCYGFLGRESKLNVVVGFCGFPGIFNEVPEIPGMRLGGHSLRRNQFAPMSENRRSGHVHPDSRNVSSNRTRRHRSLLRLLDEA